MMDDELKKLGKVRKIVNSAFDVVKLILQKISEFKKKEDNS